MSDKVKVTTSRPVLFEGTARTEFETTEQHRRELEKLGLLVLPADRTPSAPSTAGKGDTPPAPELTDAQKFVDGTVVDVTARIEGADKDVLQAALEAELAKGDKQRKGVIDALNAALAA